MESHGDGDSGSSGTGTGGSTGGDTSGGETTTLASITNSNIGDYIDLGNNIVGTTATSDDWRVLYVEGSTVYAILADYLPNSTGYAASAGLDTSGTYVVYSSTDRDTLLTGLTTSSNWAGLANGITGATVTGTPTAELLMNSYNTKNGTNIVYTDYEDSYFMLDATTEDFNLYVPHYATSEPYDYEGCYGYWLASPHASYSSNVWYVLSGGYVGCSSYASADNGVRPVVTLTSSIECSYADGVWTVE